MSKSNKHLYGRYAPPLAFDRALCPTNKIGYPNKKRARHPLNIMRTIDDNPSSLNIYRCYHCRFWHIGHSNRLSS